MFYGDPSTENFPVEPVEETAPHDLVDELASVLAHRDRVEARAVEILARVKETRAFERDGYSSPTALLKHRMSLHPGEAQRLVHWANALATMPATARAYREGAITGAQVDVLCEVRAIAPERFSEWECSLVDIAVETPTVGELRNRLDHWLNVVAPEDLATDRMRVREVRSLTLRREGEMMRINGWTDLESGERLAARLDPGPPSADDERTLPQRRADLLLEMVEKPGHRPNLVVHVSAESLFHGHPGVSETAGGTFLTTEEIQRLACDSDLTRVVFGPDSLPLDVGRTRRLVTKAQRIAIAARDRTCVFPTCDRPEPWLDVHHIVPWIRGGPTDIDNLVLLCRYHHTRVHEGGWEIEGKPGDLHFIRPDGTQLGVEPPPRPAYRSPLITPSDNGTPAISTIREAIARVAVIRQRHGP